MSVAEFGQLALRCAPSVAPSTLASIAQTESAFQVLSVNDNTTHTSGVPATREVAVQIAAKLLEAGDSIDVGLMQINSANFGKLGLTLDAAFDPCRSIAAAAALLAGDYAGGDTHEAQQSSLRTAISKYNTGDATRGFENGYVHKVELAAHRVVPAIDVGAPSAAIDRQTLPAPAAAAPVDPNAPPPWDVWASYDYGATHMPGSEIASRDLAPAAPADAVKGPAAPASEPGPVSQR